MEQRRALSATSEKSASPRDISIGVFCDKEHAYARPARFLRCIRYSVLRNVDVHCAYKGDRDIILWPLGHKLSYLCTTERFVVR